MPLLPEGADVEAAEPFDVLAFVVVESLEVVGAGGGVDDDEVGVVVEEACEPGFGGWLVGFEVAEPFEVVVGGAEVS